jgi:predicted phage terminase large subunit-like protein
VHGSVNLLELDREWSEADLDVIEECECYKAQQSFWSYRQFMNPQMILRRPGAPRSFCWWQREVALELHRFWLEYQAGRRPKLLLQSPPQHGKSTMAVDFLSWAIGQSFLEKQRNIKIIFASFSDRLGIRANLRLQRIFRNPKYAKIFGRVILDDARANSQMIEFAYGKSASEVDRGYFRNTTVQGAVTGEGLDIGVVDDPIKGRAEASSQLNRDKTWNWMTDDFLTRFSDQGALLMIMTRWHLDDPAGRLIEHHPSVRVCRFPALAEKDEEFRKQGEPLFPELKSLEFLQKQRSVMTLAGWESIYQQAPIVVGGDMFPVEKAVIIPERPASKDVVSAVRYWDKAGTSQGGAFTAGVLMLRMRDGTFTVVDVRRGQWGALDRERMIRQTAEVDRNLYHLTKVWVEQEGGSGGKESAESTIRNLAGYSVEADRVSGPKEVRADPFAAQWQAGNVRLVSAPWNRDYLDEHEHFPAGKYKDQVDASSGAFNKIASKYRYDSTLAWVG